jgi:hypothetical protein
MGLHEGSSVPELVVKAKENLLPFCKRLGQLLALKI